MKIEKFSEYINENINNILMPNSNEGFQLKTKKGSTIKRSGNVGKRMGGDLYLHKQYADEIDQDLYNDYKDKLPKGFKYNILKYNKNNETISFINSPDFDTADEPIVGDSYKVSKNGITYTRQKNPPQIYHHKWLFVDDDYKGFDVDKAKERSRKWLMISDKINMSKIGNKKYWDEEVLPLLEGLWDVRNQEYKSTRTSINQVPRIFMEIINNNLYNEGDINLDIGGGKYDKSTEYLSRFGVTNYIFDPFNRDNEHNKYVISKTENGQSDSVTVLNVLNVIKEEENQIQILKQAKNAVKKGGVVYIFSNYKVYGEVSRPVKGRDSYQHYDMSLKDYLPMVQEVMPDAYINKNIRCIVWVK